MIHLDRKTYKNTLTVLRNMNLMPQMFVELKNHMTEQFGVTAFNYIYKEFDFIKNKRTADKTKILECILSSREDYDKMCLELFAGYDERKQNIISNKFVELSRKYDCVLHENANQIWVTYYDFSAEYIAEIVKVKKIEKIIKKIHSGSGIWRIYSCFGRIVIFYKNENLKEDNEKNNTSNKIQKDCLEIIKLYDEFGFYKQDYITFDSKENLEKNYEGNLFYYFK